LAVYPLETRLERARPPFTPSRRLRRGAGAATLAALVVTAIAAGAPAWISKEARLFTKGSAAPFGDLRARLTSVSSDGRTTLWHAALKGFASESVHGTGAGTYEFVW
jgi:O-antigen ligase